MNSRFPDTKHTAMYMFVDGHRAGRSRVCRWASAALRGLQGGAQHTTRAATHRTTPSTGTALRMAVSSCAHEHALTCCLPGPCRYTVYNTALSGSLACICHKAAR